MAEYTVIENINEPGKYYVRGLNSYYVSFQELGIYTPRFYFLPQDKSVLKEHMTKLKNKGFDVKSTIVFINTEEELRNMNYSLYKAIKL